MISTSQQCEEHEFASPNTQQTAAPCCPSLVMGLNVLFHLLTFLTNFILNHITLNRCYSNDRLTIQLTQF